MRPRWKKLIWIAPVGIVGIMVFIALGGAIVMWLWNWLVPPVFGWPALTFWQAIGLLALCRILFGGLGGRGSRGGHFRRRMAARWDSMTPEERERFRMGMRARCDFGPVSGDTQTPE